MKKYWLFIIILFASLFFRLINLDKAGGLWYDEAAIYSIASQNSVMEMLRTDPHRFLMFPLYYMIYHAWINIFGNSDIIIRLMSVFFDILALIAAYFAGRQLAHNINKNENKIELMYMLLYGINSSFIYYSQEAKFYSLTFLLINLIIIFWLKFINNNSDKNIYILSLLNLILILTYTSQILLALILFVLTIIIMKDRITIKQILIYASSFIPILLFIIFYKNYFSGNFDAVIFDNSFIILAIQNWFTPMLNGLQNNILKYNLYILNNFFNIKLWLFVIFPSVFIVYSIIGSVKKYTTARYLFLIAFLYISLHILLSNFTNYNVLVRYTLPALPFLLICAAGNIRIKWVGLFVIVNILGILAVSGAPFIKRPDGYRLLGENLKQAEISENYDYILPIRINLLDKYFNIKGRRISLYSLNSLTAQKTYLTEEEINGINNNLDKNQYLKRYILNDNIPPAFEAYVEQNFINENNIVLLTDKSISMFNNEQLKLIANSPNLEKYPFQFLRLSKLNNDIFNILSKKMHFKKKIIYQNWEISVFEL